jgi:phage-related protein
MADTIPVEILIKAKDEASATLDKTAAHFAKLNAAAVALGTVAGGIVGTGISLITENVGKIGRAMIDGNAEMQRYETQFGVLLGSTEAAQQRLKELAEFGAKTPFELPQVVVADKILQGFGLHSEEAAKKFGFSGTQIRTIAGDVASGAGVSFEEMAGYIGKFSSGATGEAIARFQELGIMTREQMAGMGLEFSKSGELLSPLPQATEVMLTLMKQKYGGMMDAQSSTFEGMVSNLNDWVGQAIRTVGQPIFEVVSDSLKEVLAFLNEPSTQAAIKDFAKMMADNLKAVVAWVKENWPAISKTIGDVFAAIGVVWTNVLKPVLDVIVQVVGSVIDWIVLHWPEISTAIGDVFNAIKSVWDNVLKPVIDVILSALAGVVKWVAENWGGISKAFEDVANAVKWVWDNVLKPVVDAVVNGFAGLVKAGQDIGNFLQNPIGSLTGTTQPQPVRNTPANNNNIQVTIYGKNDPKSTAQSVQTSLYRAGFAVTP